MTTPGSYKYFHHRVMKLLLAFVNAVIYQISNFVATLHRYMLKWSEMSWRMLARQENIIIVSTCGFFFPLQLHHNKYITVKDQHAALSSSCSSLLFYVRKRLRHWVTKYSYVLKQSYGCMSYWYLCDKYVHKAKCSFLDYERFFIIFLHFLLAHK